MSIGFCTADLRWCGARTSNPWGLRGSVVRFNLLCVVTFFFYYIVSLRMASSRRKLSSFCLLSSWIAWEIFAGSGEDTSAAGGAAGLLDVAPAPPVPAPRESLENGERLNASEGDEWRTSKGGGGSSERLPFLSSMRSVAVGLMAAFCAPPGLSGVPVLSPSPPAPAPAPDLLALELVLAA